MRNRRWFLFIEGSIVYLFAWVGILSAALFPSMSAYLERSRDTARTSHLWEYSTALWAYYADNESYPEPIGWCIPGLLLAEKWYILSTPLTDPQKKNTYPCDGSEGMTYAYRVYSDASGISHFLIAAELENLYGWNTFQSIDEFSLSDLENIDELLIKWSGDSFVIRSN